MSRINEPSEGRKSYTNEMAIKSFACPYCKVGKGAMCIGLHGQERTSVHPSRLEAYEQLHKRVSEAMERQKRRREQRASQAGV